MTIFKKSTFFAFFAVVIFSGVFVFAVEPASIVREALNRKIFSEKELVESLCAKETWELEVFSAMLDGLSLAFDASIQKAAGVALFDFSQAKALLQGKLEKLCSQEKFSGALDFLQEIEDEENSLRFGLREKREKIILNLKTKKQELESANDKTGLAEFQAAASKLEFISETSRKFAFAELKNHVQDKSLALGKIGKILQAIVNDRLDFVRGSVEGRQAELLAAKQKNQKTKSAEDYLKETESIKKSFTSEINLAVAKNSVMAFGQALAFFQSKLLELKNSFESDLAAANSALELCQSFDDALSLAEQSNVKIQASLLEIEKTMFLNSKICGLSVSRDCSEINAFSLVLSRFKEKNLQAAEQAKNIKEICFSVLAQNQGKQPSNVGDLVISLARTREELSGDFNRLKTLWTRIETSGLAKNMREEISVQDACGLVGYIGFDRAEVEDSLKNLSTFRARCAKPCVADKDFCSAKREVCSAYADDFPGFETLAGRGEKVLIEFDKLDSSCQDQTSSSALEITDLLGNLRVSGESYLYSYDELTGVLLPEN